eukprot:CAMPEP_0172454542 /NCGR_PEP_ID=MMETSP1065-20121228/11495_1 /TAXON_ID=265537 /ORGANISM="Amphiprora paludosa, Strain CCMP125" /LENGTH=618 /DNA_ID=CAMNT_0013206885 /DNA_START=42 /DNA_END=1898 /DNA_ORIENTATION=+
MSASAGRRQREEESSSPASSSSREQSRKRPCVDPTHPNGKATGLVVYAWGKAASTQWPTQQDDNGVNEISENDPDEPVQVLAESSGVTQLACGRGHAFILTQDGQIQRWGPAHGGWDSVAPAQRTLRNLPSAWRNLPRMKRLTSGPSQFAALDDQGHLFTWGQGAYGKLGHGTEDCYLIPRRVMELESVPLQQVACGTCHTVALSTSGKVYTWGWNSSGRTGHGTQEGKQMHPRLVQRLVSKEIRHVAAGAGHTAAVATWNGPLGLSTHCNDVYTWGSGESGKLGHGNETCQLVPQRVEGLAHVPVRQVACGGFHTAVVSKDGKLYAWGKNDDGQLGNGTDEENWRPTLVQGLDGMSVEKIILGEAHSVAITDTGGVYTWGSSSLGNVHGSTSVLEPKRMESLHCQRVVDAVCFGYNGIAVLVDSSLEKRNNDFVPIATALHTALNDDKYSDVTFMLGNDQENLQPVYAHRIILVQKCDFFRTMFESGLRESSEKVIPIPNVDRNVFCTMLQYLYTDTATVGLENAVPLYNLAEMYFLEQLKSLCCKAVRQQLTRNTVAPLLQEAVDSQCWAIKDICLHYAVHHYVEVADTEGMNRLSQEILLEIIQAHATHMRRAAL